MYKVKISVIVFGDDGEPIMHDANSDTIIDICRDIKVCQLARNLKIDAGGIEGDWVELRTPATREFYMPSMREFVSGMVELQARYKCVVSVNFELRG